MYGDFSEGNYSVIKRYKFKPYYFTRLVNMNVLINVSLKC